MGQTHTSMDAFDTSGLAPDVLQPLSDSLTDQIKAIADEG